MNQLRNRPRLIVGTPGRINDHLQRKTLELKNTNFLVLDETDRMLDMGFSVQLERIFKYMPEKRQTLMFSATLPPNILKMSEQYMDRPKRVKVGETNIVAQIIKTDVIKIDQSQKYDQLILELHEREGSVIIFIKTKYGADRMAKNLRRDGFTAEALHGGLRQSKREKVMKNYRDDNFRILVATDIAARGLDVPSIQHVVNFDLPQVAEDYIHRMGRTARAGASGSALCFVSPQDGRKWHAIECLLDPNKKTNDRKYDKTKPKRRKSNASNSKPGARRDDRKRDGGKDNKWKKDKPLNKRNRDDRDGDEKRDFKKKPFKQKREGANDDSADGSFKKKPYKQSRNRNRDDRNENGSSDEKKKSFKKPFKSKNNDERSDRPKFDKPRGKKPLGKKPGGKPGSKSGFSKPKSADGKGFNPKTAKKKPAKKNNAKKRSY